MTTQEMTNADIEARMRYIEDKRERQASPEAYLVARLDGRAFPYPYERFGVEKPFDSRFRDFMIETAKHVMRCGFPYRLCLCPERRDFSTVRCLDATFDRRYSKLISILAGEASAALSLELGTPATFDCRLLELRDLSEVQAYFTWRQRDAERNCLNAHSYWTLRKAGLSARAATRELSGLSRDQKRQSCVNLPLLSMARFRRGNAEESDSTTSTTKRWGPIHFPVAK